jgi:hypothetical protein
MPFDHAKADPVDRKMRGRRLSASGSILCNASTIGGLEKPAGESPVRGFSAPGPQPGWLGDSLEQPAANGYVSLTTPAY